MSDLQIAVISEGPTDLILIEALLKHLLKRPFLLDLLQPQGSVSFGNRGTGWPGIYQWCRQLLTAGEDLALNPLLAKYHLLILHIDADVAHTTYAAGNIDDAPTPDNLPCECECPPAKACVNALVTVVANWLAIPQAVSFPASWVFCIPSQSLEAWAVAALYTDPDILEQLECRQGLSNWVKSRPKKERDLLKKSTANYHQLSQKIVSVWEQVTAHCSQAARFEQDLLKQKLKNAF